MMMICAGKSVFASARQISGPIPAGSPLVTAIVGFLFVFETVFDIGLITLLTQPVLISLIGFTFAQRHTRNKALTIFGTFINPSLQYLDQMQSEGRLHDFADFLETQLVHRPFKFRHGVALINPTKIATLGSRRVVGIQARLLSKVSAVIKTLFDRCEFTPRIGLGSDFGDTNQDMTRMGLLECRQALRRAFTLNQFNDMKPRRAAQDIRYFARF